MNTHHPIRDLPINAYCGEREWQPIETAPGQKAILVTDGTWVYVAERIGLHSEDQDFVEPLRGRFITDWSIITIGNGEPDAAGAPTSPPLTHWMPLPAPPVIEQTGPANPECRNPDGCDRSHRMPSCRECSAAWLTLEPSERMRRRQEARAAA